jgi:hypothetical protein
MRIEQLLSESELDEARRGNWGREQSNAAGQTIGKNMAAGMPSADANAAIQQAKTINPTAPAGAQNDLQSRLQQFKANKAATQPPVDATQQAPVDAKQTAPATNGTVTPVQQNTPQSMTGDPTLDQPLPGQAPPKKTLAQKVGGVAKGVGAVAGGVAGIGRALKKGYAAGANAVGGPGYAPAGGGAGGAGQLAYGGGSGGGAGGASGGSGGGDAEIADLKSRLGALERVVGLAR